MNPPAEEIINRVYRRLLFAEICLVVAIIPLTFFSVVISFVEAQSSKEIIRLVKKI